MERSVYRGLLLFAATLLAIWAFGLILWPFIVPIMWALCLCAVTARPYQALARTWKRPRLASGVMVLATGLVILGPIVLMGMALLDEADSFDPATTIETLKTHFPSWLEKAKEAGLNVEEIGQQLKDNAPDLIGRFVRGPIAEDALAVMLAPFVFLFGLMITLITQYFVYREAPRLRRLVHDLSPLSTVETDRILLSLRDTTSAGILGNVLVAVVQGALGGVGWAIAGLQSPFLWSAVMMAFSLLPFGGTALVWVPAAVYLLLTGQTGYGIFLVVYGVVIVSTADNIMRPWILGKTGANAIHPMLLFFAILSGIGLFGMSGIVFGPLLLALLHTVMQIYRGHYAHEGQGEPAEDAEDASPG